LGEIAVEAWPVGEAWSGGWQGMSGGA